MIKRFLGRKQTSEQLPQPLPAGTDAPDFTLAGTGGEEVTLRHLRGQPVVLVFYPKDESSVCSSQLSLYNEALHLFSDHSAQLLGISVDYMASHEAFSRALNLKYPLLSDDDPAGRVANQYGVFDESAGICRRALFVIDSEGVIRWSYVSPNAVNPGANGILEALETIAPDG